MICTRDESYGHPCDRDEYGQYECENHRTPHLIVVRRPVDWGIPGREHWNWDYENVFDALIKRPYKQLVDELLDPNRYDGEWHAFITLPHEIVECEGRGVPLFEGDVEKQEYVRRHSSVGRARS